MSLVAVAAETRVTELTWLNPLSLWFLFLVIIPAVVAFVVIIYRRERISMPRRPSAPATFRGRAGAPGGAEGEPPAGVAEGEGGASRVRTVLVALRVILLLVLVGILAQPALRTTTYRTVDSTVLVLVDDSLSMAIEDKYADRELVQKIAEFFRSTPETIESTSRYDLVRRLFRDPELGFIEGLRKKGRLVVSTFAGGLRRWGEIPSVAAQPTMASWSEPADRPGSSPRRDAEILGSQRGVEAEERVQQTRIADCVLDAVASERGGRLGGDGGSLGGGGGRISGVVLLTDGQQTPGARPMDEVARRLGQRNIPIYAVGIGNPDEPKDIRVVDLEVNDIVLAGDQVPFDVSIIADGFEGERVRVDLRFDDGIVATSYVLLEGEGRRQLARLVYRPESPGDFNVSVEVEYRPGELFRENNVASKPIKVLDQKIRVLYADDPPRWEYRYLKNALIRDPTMEAQIFLFSADADFIQESSEGVPALTRFPSTQEDLFAYHVIVLGDVDITAHLGSSQIALLKEFVQEAGGGVVFVAGPNASPARYLHTELYPLLPVEVPEADVFSTALRSEPVTEAFNVELTPVGREHEVMRLDNDPARNQAIWENRDGQPALHLPGFYWYAQTGRAKKGAVVLARHPRDVHPIDQRGRVIFAFMNFGKGRTFFSAVDNTWRWRAGVDNQYFYRFWGQVIRFCATGRLLGQTPRYSISTDKSQYSLGSAVGVDARVFDANMKPSTERTLTIYHQVRGLAAAAPERLELELDPVKGQGSYRGGLVAGRVGLHDLWIGTESERLAFRTFEVAVPALEMEDPRRNAAFLEEAARLSGGACLELHELGDLPEKIAAEARSQQGDMENVPLWDDAWVLLAFAGIIALEWILRKWVHLL